MSLLERLRALPTKSLNGGVLLSLVSTLLLSFLAFHIIADQMEKQQFNPIFDRFDEMQLESARGLFESGGPKALASYLSYLNRTFGGMPHYLLDARGRDMLTGEDRANLLPKAPASGQRTQTHGLWIISHRSPDGKYWFAAVGPLSRPHIWTFLPYYFLVIGATGVLCWLVAAGVIFPVRRIAASIALFGHGDLSIRVDTSRKDEIGQLGRSFNEMAERLERLIVSERRLLGDISHELRSPLARLKFAVKLARTSNNSEAALDRIERDVDRITSLVADIVEIAFVEGDPAVQGTAVVPCAEIVDEVLRDCSVEAEIRGCRIAVNGKLEGLVLGNRELLRRAVENVVRNAIRYAPEQTTIDISTNEDDGTAHIYVRDFGPGVPHEALSRIFDPFYRVEEARSATGGGSGLGLSIAKRAVQVHHGAICAENALPGLRVHLAIPLIPEPLLN
jgi:signal transduction histidine kinase